MTDIDDKNYRILIKRGLASSCGTLFTTDLTLKLKCPKTYIDQLLTQHPELFAEYGFNNGVAVIAKISGIKTFSIYNHEGETFAKRHFLPNFFVLLKF